MTKTSLLILSTLILALSVSGQTATGNWMQGKWEGTGYQISDKSTWAMSLTVTGTTYSIDYPSLKCGGEWRIVSMNSETATFTERLTYGKENCQDDGNVVVERLSDSQLAFRWTFPGELEVDASAILNRARK